MARKKQPSPNGAELFSVVVIVGGGLLIAALVYAFIPGIGGMAV